LIIKDVYQNDKANENVFFNTAASRWKKKVIHTFHKLCLFILRKATTGVDRGGFSVVRKLEKWFHL